MFDWEERKARSGKRNGSKVTGVGVGQAFHPAGFIRLRRPGAHHARRQAAHPHRRRQPGHLLAFQHLAHRRRSAEARLGATVIIERGDSRRHLPWNIGQFGSNTTSRWRARTTSRPWMRWRKLKEIAAQRFGGSPDDYDIDGERVFRKGSPGDGHDLCARPRSAPSSSAASSTATSARRTSTR